MINSFIITLFLIPLSILISKKLNILDLPNERKFHKKPVPKSGGLVITLTYFSILAYNYQLNLELLISTILMSVLITLDDLFKLNRYLRLFSQAIIILPLVLNILNFDYSLISQVILLSLIFLYCSFINLFNFFDGLNTILSSQFLLAIIFYFINSSSLGLIENIKDFKILIGSIIAFLFYNSSGLIFMGDIGSCFIGMFSATIFAKTILNSNFSNSILVISPFFPILCDTSITLLIRIKNKERFFFPHKTHAYQLLAQMGFSHIKVSLFYGLKLILYTSLLNLIFIKTSSLKAIICASLIIILTEIYIIKFIRHKAKNRNLI